MWPLPSMLDPVGIFHFKGCHRCQVINSASQNRYCLGRQSPGTKLPRNFSSKCFPQKAFFQTHMQILYSWLSKLKIYLKNLVNNIPFHLQFGSSSDITLMLHFTRTLNLVYQKITMLLKIDRVILFNLKASWVVMCLLTTCYITILILTYLNSTRSKN